MNWPTKEDLEKSNFKIHFTLADCKHCSDMFDVYDVDGIKNTKNISNNI